MNAAALAAALGKPRREGREWRCLCPAHDDHTPSLSITEKDGQLLVICRAGCDQKRIWVAIRRRGGGNLSGTGGRRDDRRNDDATARTEVAHRVWDGLRDDRRLLAAYLRSRGIETQPPRSLRGAAACKHPSGVYRPAMVAKAVSVDNQFRAIHRTFLRADGSGKAEIEPDKASLGPLAGCAVRLAAFEEGRALIVGEGIETTLALMQLRGLPGWAAVSTSGLKSLLLPREINRVLIAADHDRNAAGEVAAREAARRWMLEGREVRIAMPAGFGDWNDVIRGKCDA